MMKGHLRTPRNVRLYLAASDNVTRNSANDATDDDEVTMATLVVPPNNGAVPGTIFEFWSLWENTNSANTKNFIERINGTSVGSTSSTTNQALGQRQPLHVVDANTLVAINSFASAGGGATAGTLLSVTVPSLAVNGFTLTLLSKWSVTSIAGEFIRLRHSKIVQINPA